MAFSVESDRTFNADVTSSASHETDAEEVEYFGSGMARIRCESYGDAFGDGSGKRWKACSLRMVCKFKGYCIVAKNDRIKKQTFQRENRNREYIRRRSLFPL